MYKSTSVWKVLSHTSFCFYPTQFWRRKNNVYCPHFHTQILRLRKVKITLLNYHTLLNALNTQGTQTYLTITLNNYKLIFILKTNEKVLIPWFKFYLILLLFILIFIELSNLNFVNRGKIAEWTLVAHFTVEQLLVHGQFIVSSILLNLFPSLPPEIMQQISEILLF